MAFCSNCGNEITPEARFCGSCGTEQKVSVIHCGNCGKPLEENEKFCSGCGTPVKKPSKVKTEPKPTSKSKEPNLTKEGRKIIDAGPKTSQTKKKKTQASPTPVSPKKKRGCLARIFRLLGILILLVVALFVVVYFLPDPETKPNDEGLTDTNIPGIVDIEPGDVSHLPENRNSETEPDAAKTFIEEKDIKEAANSVEEAFANADTTQFKLLLTNSALKTYSGILKEIQPHMPEYAKAFKNRKLITSTDIYQLYEFNNESDEKYTAAFEFQLDGSWKLTRF